MNAKRRLSVCLLASFLATEAVLWCGCIGTRFRKYEGRVLDADTGKPVANARVEATFYMHGKWSPHGTGLFAREPVRLFTQSDEHGKFRLYGGKDHTPFQAYDLHGRDGTWSVDGKDPENIVIQMKTGRTRDEKR